MATNPLMDFYFSRLDRAADEKSRDRAQTLQEQQLAENVNQFLQSIALDREKFGEAKSQFGQTFKEGQLRADQAKAARDEATRIAIAQAQANNLFRPAKGPEIDAFAAGGQMLAPINQRKAAIDEERRRLEQAEETRKRDYEWLVSRGVNPMVAALTQKDPNAAAAFYGNPRNFIGALYDPTITPANLDNFIKYNQALSPGMIETDAERAAKFGQANMSNAHASVYNQQMQDLALNKEGRWLIQKAYESAAAKGLTVDKPEFLNHVVNFINKGIENPQIKQSAMQIVLGESAMRPMAINPMAALLGGVATPTPAQPAKPTGPVTPPAGVTLPKNATPEQIKAYEMMRQLLGAEFEAPR